MYTLETIESLQAYADRLHRDVVNSRGPVAGPRTPFRSLLRNAAKGRRTS